LLNILVGRKKGITVSRFFDPHIHMYSRTTDDYDAMSKAGIEVIVQPSFWLGAPRRFVGTFEDYWEHMITFETSRAKEFGIQHFVCISVNPKEAAERPLALEALDAMVGKGYLDRERVVAIGEIGYNLINDLEEEIFTKQMDIASEKKMLMTIHLPHNNKPEGMRRIEKILNDADNEDRYNRYRIRGRDSWENVGAWIVGWPVGLSFLETLSRKGNENYKKARDGKDNGSQRC
jgi:predicted metal-dependent TIM-barrel fold hydrolase